MFFCLFKSIYISIESLLNKTEVRKFGIFLFSNAIVVHSIQNSSR